MWGGMNGPEFRWLRAKGLGLLRPQIASIFPVSGRQFSPYEAGSSEVALECGTALHEVSHGGAGGSWRPQGGFSLRSVRRGFLCDLTPRAASDTLLAGFGLKEPSQAGGTPQEGSGMPFRGARAPLGVYLVGVLPQIHWHAPLLSTGVATPLHPLSSVKSGYLPRCLCGVECLQNVHLLWAAREPGTGGAIPSDSLMNRLDKNGVIRVEVCGRLTPRSRATRWAT